MNKNCVFIATSLDGYIADSQGQIDWLHSIPNPMQEDMGYGEFMQKIDALIMGRVTFETVLGFGISWPYTQPVFVLSNSLTSIPQELQHQVFLVQGELKNVLAEIHAKGFHRLYIDGGSTIRSFLNEDLIDEMTLTTLPILLGGGTSLFGELHSRMNFKLTATQVFLNQVVQSQYHRSNE